MDAKLNVGGDSRAEQPPLILRRRWFGPADVITVIGVSLVDVLCVGLLRQIGWQPWVIAAAAVAALATYAAGARLLNSSTTTVRGSGVEVRIGPLPWPSPRALPTDKIRSIERIHEPLKWDFGGLSRYVVTAQTASGPVRVYERLDVDGDVTGQVAAEIRRRLWPTSH